MKNVAFVVRNIVKAHVCTRSHRGENHESRRTRTIFYSSAIICTNDVVKIKIKRMATRCSEITNCATIHRVAWAIDGTHI